MLRFRRHLRPLPRQGELCNGDIGNDGEDYVVREQLPERFGKCQRQPEESGGRPCHCRFEPAQGMRGESLRSVQTGTDMQRQTMHAVQAGGVQAVRREMLD